MMVGIVRPEKQEARINPLTEPLLWPIINELIPKQSDANITSNRCPKYLMAKGRKIFQTPVIT